MEERILQILNELVSMKSVSCSRIEQEPAKWFASFFESMPYFQKHPEDTGLYVIPGDPYGRMVPYAFLKGRKPDTVLLSGHFDVVSTEEYGKAEEYAYQIEKNDTLLDILKNSPIEMPLTEQQMQDLESGDYIWGRGVADMKGGLAIHAALFEEYAKQADAEGLEGSILFVPVCDEESYSAGMRNAAHILRMFKEKYDLTYKLMIDPEPTKEENGIQTLSLGSVGKTMPAIIVQGKKGHAGFFYKGFSALNIISDIYLRTNGSLEFCDVYKDEATVPPTWANMRDMKPGYDVSIPHRAYGYFTVLSFDSTPADIEAKLKKICIDAFNDQVKKINSEYQIFKTMSKAEKGDQIYYEPMVLTFHELCEMTRNEYGEDFDRFYKETYEKVIQRIADGESNYPNGTIEFMEAVLNYSNLQTPITVIGFAPPYYPAIHSDLIKGKEGYGSKAHAFVNELSKEKFGREIITENYFMGISDLSYSGITTPFDYESFSKDTPLWGDAYSIDFDAMEFFSIPSIIYGPIGKDYHTYAERVLKKSLLEELPVTTKALIEYMWTI